MLAQAHIVDMHRLTNDDPTTLAKDGEVAVKLPIDHCLANKGALDLGVKVKVDYTLRISDHLPILLRLPLRSSQFMCVEWAKPTKSLPPKTIPVPWTATPCDFFQWQEAAKNWLQSAHACTIEPKGTVKLKPFERPKPREKHVKFRRLLTLQRAVAEWD